MALDSVVYRLLDNLISKLLTVTEDIKPPQGKEAEEFNKWTLQTFDSLRKFKQEIGATIKAHQVNESALANQQLRAEEAEKNTVLAENRATLAEQKAALYEQKCADLEKEVERLRSKEAEPQKLTKEQLGSIVVGSTQLTECLKEALQEEGVQKDIVRVMNGAKEAWVKHGQEKIDGQVTGLKELFEKRLKSPITELLEGQFKEFFREVKGGFVAKLGDWGRERFAEKVDEVIEEAFNKEHFESAMADRMVNFDHNMERVLGAFEEAGVKALEDTARQLNKGFASVRFGLENTVPPVTPVPGTTTTPISMGNTARSQPSATTPTATASRSALGVRGAGEHGSSRTLKKRRVEPDQYSVLRLDTSVPDLLENMQGEVADLLHGILERGPAPSEVVAAVEGENPRRCIYLHLVSKRNSEWQEENAACAGCVRQARDCVFFVAEGTAVRIARAPDIDRSS